MDSEDVDGFIIRSDHLGFVLFTEQFVSRLLEYLGPEQSPLDFLTTDARADELTADGLYMPFLGIRMWPYRVHWNTGPSAIPLGLETRPSVHLRLVGNEDGTIAVCPGGVLEDVAALAAGTWPRIPVPFGGVLKVRTFVTGGDLTTFLLSRADDDVDLDSPLINADFFSEWHELVEARGSEDEGFGVSDHR